MANANVNLESKRWLIAGAAVVMQLNLGTVYAWSVFKKALIAMHGTDAATGKALADTLWTAKGVQVTFMIVMACIALAAAFGGQLVDKKGPRFTAVIGGILFAVGTLLAGLSVQIGNIYLLYISYGVIAGIGNGFCYVTPIATLIRWFPDKRGLVTGLAVMGFGLGAFFMGLIAPKMLPVTVLGPAKTFYVWGVIYLILVVGAAQLFINPPAGWCPTGFVAKAGTGCEADSFEFGQALRTPQWWMLWSMLGLNVAAGLGLISNLSPMAQDVAKVAKPDIAMDVAKLAAAGGLVVSITAIFNGLGRLFWASVSDKIGRKNVFLIMFVTQAILYILLPKISSYMLFTILGCYLLACYGGGFATMPAFAADAFGPKNIGKIYGMMLTAWGVAGIVGPLVFASVDKKTALFVAAGLLSVGFVITLIYKKPAPKTS
jgi:MFS transporter, OFA family, oxalate/formate antiporter